MKLKQFTKVVTVGSFGTAFCFLASCKEDADAPTTQADKPATEAPAKTAKPEVATEAAPTPDTADTATNVPVYIVTVSGKG